jgi:hypothetical protein
MVGLQATAAKFGVWSATLIMFALCSESLGYVCAIVTPGTGTKNGYKFLFV